MIVALLVAIFHGLGVLSAVHALMGTRTEQGAIAWVVSLITFPYVAVPAYWVLGRSKFQGYTTALRDEMEKIVSSNEEVAETVRTQAIDSETLGAAGRAAERLAGLPFVGGNDIDLLIDGDATFDSILDGLDRAENYILFQFFIVHDDRIGRAIKSKLIERAKAEIRVFFLYDEVGCKDLPESYWAELREAGVMVHDFHTRQGRGNRFQINFRNHRKVVVVDGRECWIGGHNVGDEYLGRDPKFGHWRDTHVRITGPATLGAQVSFFEDWFWATGERLTLDWHGTPSADGDLPVLILPSGPADEYETASLMFVHAINSANDRIWIASPYFVPDQAVMTALKLAALREVDVRILIPDKADHLLVYLAAFSYQDQLKDTGVQIYRYQDGFLHQKAMLVDDYIATVGTANFDNRSFRLNFEITAVVGGTEFAERVEAMLLEDFDRSVVMPADAYSSKPWWFRVGVRLARLTSPIQ